MTQYKLSDFGVDEGAEKNVYRNDSYQACGHSMDHRDDGSSYDSYHDMIRAVDGAAM